MRSPFPMARVYLLFLVAGFLGILGWIFSIQFSGGGNYPSGSSLRADPQGTMILFESLQALPGLEVERNLDPLGRRKLDPEDSLLVMINASDFSLRNPELKRFVQAGGQVLVHPTGGFWKWVEETQETIEKMEGPEDVEDEPVEDSTEEEAASSMELFPGMGELLPTSELPPLQAEIAERSPGDWARAQRVSEHSGGPAEISWREGAVFTEVPGEPLYQLDGQTVLSRVEDGAGSWWILSDSALLLNGAIYRQRESEWLAWLFGQDRRILFDETHFGIERPRGIMTLIRRFGFVPFLLSLFLPMSLLIWRGSQPFLPVEMDQDDPDELALSRLDGYRDLLARHIPASQLLTQMLDAWKDDVGEAARRRLAAQIPEAEALAKQPLPRRDRLTALQRNLLQLHRRLQPRTRKHHD